MGSLGGVECSAVNEALNGFSRMVTALLSVDPDLARDLVRATPDVFADIFLRGRVS